MKWISADYIKELMKNDRLMQGNAEYKLWEQEVDRRVDAMPGIIDPVKHGRWNVVDFEEPRRWGCSECHVLSWDTSRYCPNCGARMDEE